MTHFLNVSEDVYEANPDPFRGEYVINKSWLDVEGYFGFNAIILKFLKQSAKLLFI